MIIKREKQKGKTEVRGKKISLGQEEVRVKRKKKQWSRRNG